MTHQRRTIFAAFVGALEGTATAGGNVYQANPKPRDLEALASPIVIVSMPAETVERSAAGGVHERTVQLEADIHVRGDASAEATADAIGVEIEAAIGADRTLGGACRACVLEQMAMGTSSELDARAATQRLTFVAAYRTSEEDPETQV